MKYKSLFFISAVFFALSGCDRGYNQGYKDGKRDGYEEGYIDGYNQGYKEGYSKGRWEEAGQLISDNYVPTLGGSFLILMLFFLVIFAYYLLRKPVYDMIISYTGKVDEFRDIQKKKREIEFYKNSAISKEKIKFHLKEIMIDKINEIQISEDMKILLEKIIDMIALKEYENFLKEMESKNSNINAVIRKDFSETNLSKKDKEDIFNLVLNHYKNK